jgi:UPF0716 family protein affecting phage T7 exclusion
VLFVLAGFVVIALVVVLGEALGWLPDVPVVLQLLTGLALGVYMACADAAHVLAGQRQGSDPPVR